MSESHVFVQRSGFNKWGCSCGWVMPPTAVQDVIDMWAKHYKEEA